MIRGFYTALSGIVSSMTRQAVVADNIANTSTVGFKQSRTSQDDFELQIMNSQGPELGELERRHPDGLTLDTSQGPLQETNNQTDMAVEGDGLFVVRRVVASPTPGRATSRWTRQHARDEQATRFLDTAGHTIQPGQTFTVGSDGTIVETGQAHRPSGLASRRCDSPPGGAKGKIL